MHSVSYRSQVSARRGLNEIMPEHSTDPQRELPFEHTVELLSGFQDSH